MNDSVMVDVRYALKQLRLACGRSHNSVADMVTRDCCQRALDALERVEAAIVADLDHVEPDEEADGELAGERAYINGVWHVWEDRHWEPLPVSEAAAAAFHFPEVDGGQR